MITRALSSSGDFTYGAGKNNYLSGEGAVAQTIGTNLLMFLGDCFFATNQGIDWWTFLGGSKNQTALQLAISAVILNTLSDGNPVVTGITAVSVNLNDTTRQFSVVYDVTTIFGNIQGVATQNLGIGAVNPPVFNLLPQMNQTLLNNVGATAINGAVFASSAFWEVDLEYFATRRSTAGNFEERGTLFCIFNSQSQIWTIDKLVESGSSGPTTGVAFTIDPASGQVYYASDNLGGTGYVGNLIINSLQTFVAGQ